MRCSTTGMVDLSPPQAVQRASSTSECLLVQALHGIIAAASRLWLAQIYSSLHTVPLSSHYFRPLFQVAHLPQNSSQGQINYRLKTTPLAFPHCFFCSETIFFSQMAILEVKERFILYRMLHFFYSELDHTSSLRLLDKNSCTHIDICSSKY